MHTPGSAAHHAAHHHASDVHHAAHRSAVSHAQRAADHSWDAFDAPRVHDVPPGRTRRGGHPRGDRTSDVVGPLRFAVKLAVVVVLVGVVLLVLRPSHPEWLAQLVHEVEGLLGMLRSAFS